MTQRKTLLHILLLGMASLAIAASSGCKGEPGKPAATPTANTPTAAVPAPNSPPAALPASPDRTADVEKAVALLCPQKNIVRLNDGKLSGCKTCPDGTDFRDPMGDEWRFNSATFGHFMSPSDDNLLVGGTGCDSHAMNWGGSFLFTFKMGQPKLVRYDKGLITAKCHKFALAGGRDFLMCQGGWTGQGENVSTVFSVVLDATGKDTQEFLFSTTDTGGNCGDSKDTVVRITNVQDVQFASKESGEVSGMTVKAYLGDIKCGVAMVKRPEGELPPGVKAYNIDFAFDGKKFQVTPASKTTLKLFESD